MCETDRAADDERFAAARTEPSVFADFYERRRGRVLAFLYRRTHCPQASADLTSETFAQAWASLDRYDPGRGAPLPWVLGIARNLHRRWARHERVRNSVRGRIAITDRTDDEVEGVERLADVDRARSSVTAALARLSPAMHDAVTLRVLCDLPYDEVAHRLGCSTGAARVRVSRALELLASELGGPDRWSRPPGAGQSGSASPGLPPVGGWT